MQGSGKKIADAVRMPVEFVITIAAACPISAGSTMKFQYILLLILAASVGASLLHLRSLGSTLRQKRDSARPGAAGGQGGASHGPVAGDGTIAGGAIGGEWDDVVAKVTARRKALGSILMEDIASKSKAHESDRISAGYWPQPQPHPEIELAAVDVFVEKAQDALTSRGDQHNLTGTFYAHAVVWVLVSALVYLTTCVFDYDRPGR